MPATPFRDASAPARIDRRTRHRNKGARVLAATYLAAILAVLVARHIIAEAAWWSALLLYAPPMCYALPLIVLLPVAALSRDRIAIGALTLLLLLTFGPVMGAVTHNPFSRSYGGKRVRLLSYNIHSGKLGFQHVAAHLRRYEPDVLVFTEARELREIDALPADLREPLSGWHSAYGDDVFIASRWPIIAREATQLSRTIRRSLVRATIRSPHGEFHVIGAHYFTHLLTAQQAVKSSFPRMMKDSAEARLQQTGEVLTLVDHLKGPVLLAGDFNNPPAGRAYAMVRKRFKDSHRGAGWGWGYTFPSAFPLWRIDYIFYDSWWNIVRTEVGAAPGSDHRPLFAEFSLNGNNNGT